MKNLKEYIIKDRNTQYEREEGENSHFQYELYGKTEFGVLFERDYDNPERLLFHVADGVKTISYYGDREHYFFRKNSKGSTFFANYSDYEDYTYSETVKDMSNGEMIKVLESFVYLHSPDIGSKTLMGWRRKDGDNSPINDPNWCENHILLDNGKDYTIIKRKDTVRLFEGVVNKFYFDDNSNLSVVEFKLDRDLYEKAIEVDNMGRQILSNFYNETGASLLEKYISLKEEVVKGLEVLQKGREK